MSDLLEHLQNEFQDPDYRYAYAESFLNTKIATQIKVLREQREQTQAELAAIAGTKQAGFWRFEDVNHSVWKTDTLWKIARALGVRVNISFETFGSLVYEKQYFDKEHLERPDFDKDPVFVQGHSPAAISWFPGMTLCGPNAYMGAGMLSGTNGVPTSIYPASGELKIIKKPMTQATLSNLQFMEMNHG